MLSDTQKGIIVSLFSLLVSAVVFVGGYEWYQSMKYDRWKAEFEKSEEWYGKMTIPSDNKTLMWEYRPHGHYQKLHTNGFGFRDEDYQTADKPDGVYRVAFIGDSVTLGYDVDYDEIFVRRFDAWAKRALPGTKVQALNFGVDGYNSLQIQEMLVAKVLDYEPDKVVYVMSLNDFDFEDASGEKIRYFSKPESFVMAKLKVLYQRLSDEDYYEYYWQSDKDYYEHYFERNRDKVYAAINAMNQLLEKKDIDFQVAILPVFIFEQPSFDNYPAAGLHERIMRFLGQNKIPAIDLLVGFRALNGPPKQYALDEWHPNKLGHQVIAEQLRSLLDARVNTGM